MNKCERKILETIYTDCICLQKQNRLTEYGKGQLNICELLLKTK